MNKLALPGDPLVTEYGEIVDESDIGEEEAAKRAVERRSLIPFHIYKPAKELRPTQIPEADKEQQSVIALVIAMRLMGMSSVDIAEYLNTSQAKIEEISELPATQMTFELMVRGVIDANSTLIQGRIASHAETASGVIVDLMTDEKAPHIVKLKSAQDVLDRAGTHADQFFRDGSDRSAQSDSLVIEISDVEDDAPKSKVKITKKG
jgi:hypothetical protein